MPSPTDQHDSGTRTVQAVHAAFESSKALLVQVENEQEMLKSRLNALRAALSLAEKECILGANRVAAARNAHETWTRLALSTDTTQCLPDEILVKIFEDADEKPDRDSWVYHSKLSLPSFGAVRFAATCPRWRVAVLATPSLWSTISLQIRLDTFQEESCQPRLCFLDMALSRSQGHPINFYFHISTEVETEEDEPGEIRNEDTALLLLHARSLFHKAHSHLHRWRQVYLDWQAPRNSPMGWIYGTEAPMMEHFSLVASPYGLLRTSSHASCATPKLRSIVLRNVEPSELSFSSVPVQKINVSLLIGSSTDGLARLIRQYQNASDIEYWVMLEDRQVPESMTQILLPHLLRLSCCFDQWTSRLPRIDCPNLRSFAAGGNIVQSRSFAEFMLTCPMLEELRFNLSAAVSTTQADSLRPIEPEIRRVLSQAFRQLSKVRTLEITSTTDKMVAVPDLLDILITQSDSPKQIMLPSLETLKLDWPNLKPLQVVKWLDSRREIDGLAHLRRIVIGSKVGAIGFTKRHALHIESLLNAGSRVDGSVEWMCN